MTIDEELIRLPDERWLKAMNIEKPDILINDKDVFIEGLVRYMRDQSDGEAGADGLRIEGAAQVMDYIEILQTPEEVKPAGEYSDKLYAYVALFFD